MKPSLPSRLFATRSLLNCTGSPVGRMELKSALGSGWTTPTRCWTHLRRRCSPRSARRRCRWRTRPAAGRRGRSGLRGRGGAASGCGSSGAPAGGGGGGLGVCTARPWIAGRALGRAVGRWAAAGRAVRALGGGGRGRCGVRLGHPAAAGQAGDGDGGDEGEAVEQRLEVEPPGSSCWSPEMPMVRIATPTIVPQTLTRPGRIVVEPRKAPSGRAAGTRARCWPGRRRRRARRRARRRRRSGRRRRRSRRPCSAGAGCRSAPRPGGWRRWRTGSGPTGRYSSTSHSTTPSARR